MHWVSLRSSESLGAICQWILGLVRVLSLCSLKSPCFRGESLCSRIFVSLCMTPGVLLNFFFISIIVCIQLYFLAILCVRHELYLWAPASAMSPCIYEPASLPWVLASMNPPVLVSMSPCVLHEWESWYPWAHMSFIQGSPCIYEPMCPSWVRVLVTMSPYVLHSRESLYIWAHVSFMWVLESNLHWTGGCGRGLRGGRGGGGELPRVQSWRGDSSHQGETREILYHEHSQHSNSSHQGEAREIL